MEKSEEFSKYRMYVDEVGNPGMIVSASSQERYLSLTGVIFELDYVRDRLHPEIEHLKTTFFRTHPDDPVVLHRTAIRNGNYPFDSLRDPQVRLRFDATLLNIVRQSEYVALTAVIDKYEHRQQYTVWQFDPYHYCMTVLVERFVRWLERRGAVGDVMAESRGGKEDRRLKNSFERIYEMGTNFMSASNISERLTSKQLKVKQKSLNIAGLQLADIIAHPCFVAAKARKNHEPLPQNFGGKIAAIIEESKYDRSQTGRIEGYGRKWLP